MWEMKCFYCKQKIQSGEAVIEVDEGTIHKACYEKYLAEKNSKKK